MATQQTPSDTGAERRVKYGLNVLVAVVAAIAIAVVLNVIAFKFLDDARFDTTHLGKYSLSPQTGKVLGELKNDYRIVTLIVRSAEQFDNAKDLIEEYDRSDKVTVDHFNPTQSRGDAFFKSLLERYESQLAPARGAIDGGRAAVGQAGDMVRQLGPVLEELYKDAMANADQKSVARQVLSYLSLFQERSEKLDKALQQSMEQSLPNFSGALSDLKGTLDELDKLLQQANEYFVKWVDEDATAGSVKDRLLQLTELSKGVGDVLADSISALNSAPPTTDYDGIRSQLSNPDTVVIMGKDQVQVLALSSMFRLPDQQAGGSRDVRDVELAFTGEEQITGALVSMELDKKPLIVFVAQGPRPASGPGGQYSAVADRLRTMNFDVQDWNPSGAPNPYGGPPQSSGPAPEAAPGQKAVWIVPPSPPPDPRNPMAAMGGQRVAQEVQKQIDAGHAVLLMFGPDPSAMFGQPNPMIKIAEAWGMTPQVDRVIHRRVILPDNRSAADRVMRISNWPDESPITRAIPGMPGAFPAACPLVLGSAEGGQVKHETLVEVSGRGLWAATNLGGDNPKYDAATAASSFTIAAAAERGNGRLIVVSDPAWASDDIVSYGLFGPGSANIAGAAFPANAELFVNSVYWLAGLDQLIAASARSQDIRRIAAMTPGGHRALQWGLPVGLPVLTFVVGLGVWWMRRSV